MKQNEQTNKQTANNNRNILKGRLYGKKIEWEMNVAIHSFGKYTRRHAESVFI